MPNQYFGPEGDLENYFVSEYWVVDQWIGDTLLTWGENTFARLGVNDGNSRITPVTTFVGGTNWKQVSSAYKYVAAIKTDGTLWTWGRNAYGQLGVNDINVRSTPVTTFAGGTDWKQVACGGYHMSAIKIDGTLWTWGRNSYGQLGNNATGTRSTPLTTFAGGTNWKQVACGQSHTAAIKIDGTLWTWGRNYSGQLGINLNGSTASRTTPVTTFAGGTNWKQVSAQGLTAAVKTDGTLWVWGPNSFQGQLGVNDGNNRNTPVTTFLGGTNWKQVSVGWQHTGAVKTDGTLWVWGRNLSGQVGNNTSADRVTPVTTFAGGTNWKQIGCGFGHSAALKTDGTLWTWGNNFNGALGNNLSTGNDRFTPVTTFAGGTNWKQIVAAEYNTMAVTSGTDPTLFIS